jgi:hypothetical protein
VHAHNFAKAMRTDIIRNLLPELQPQTPNRHFGTTDAPTRPEAMPLRKHINLVLVSQFKKISLKAE